MINFFENRSALTHENEYSDRMMPHTKSRQKSTSPARACGVRQLSTCPECPPGPNPPTAGPQDSASRAGCSGQRVCSCVQCFCEPLKRAQVEGFLMFAEPTELFGNLDELCYVRPTAVRVTLLYCTLLY